MTEAPREIIRFKGGTVLEGDIPDSSRLKQFSHDRYVLANAIPLSDALAIPEVAALVKAARELREDMMQRAQFKMDVISGEQYRIVNAGNSAWAGFVAALAGLGEAG